MTHWRDHLAVGALFVVLLTIVTLLLIGVG